LDNTIKSGLQLPINIIEAFPTLFNKIQPDTISTLIISRLTTVINWFTQSIVKAATVGANAANCSTCILTELNDGSITFGIDITDGPGLSFSVGFATVEPLYCFVNNIASLAILLHDSVPADLAQDGFEEIASLVIGAANGLADFAQVIDTSKICNRSGDVIPSVSPPNTGIDAIDTLLSGLTNFINLLGNDGVFGVIANNFVKAICATSNAGDFVKFANDVQNFANAVSFPSLEDRLFQVILNEVSQLSNGLATFTQMDLNVPDNCDTSQKNCQFVNQYGKEYLSCLQENINSGAISIRFYLSIGEHWLPPSFTGWGISLTGTADAFSCILGIKAGIGSVKNVLKFMINDIIQSNNDENTRKSCPIPLPCIGGEWDPTACACRCLSGFVASGSTCSLCPGLITSPCYNNGICYNTPNGPACCCESNKNYIDSTTCETSILKK